MMLWIGHVTHVSNVCYDICLYLAESCLEFLSSAIQQPVKKRTTKAKKKEERQNGMMNAYADGNMDIGNLNIA